MTKIFTLHHPRLDPATYRTYSKIHLQQDNYNFFFLTGKNKSNLLISDHCFCDSKWNVHHIHAQALHHHFLHEPTVTWCCFLETSHSRLQWAGWERKDWDIVTVADFNHVTIWVVKEHLIHHDAIFFHHSSHIPHSHFLQPPLDKANIGALLFKKRKKKKEEDSHQYHHNYSCTFSFLKLGTRKSYLEGHMIILGINRTWFDDGVKLMINWWVLNQMYSDTIIVQPAFNQTFNVISFLKLNYERIFNVWKCKASKWTYQAPLKLKEEGRLMRTKPRTSS